MESPVGSYHQVACENPSWFHCFSDGNMIGTVLALVSDFQFLTSCNLFTACFSFIEKFRPLLFLCIYTVHLYIYIYGLVLSCAHECKSPIYIDFYVYWKLGWFGWFAWLWNIPCLTLSLTRIATRLLFSDTRKSPHNPRHPKSWNP